MTRDYFQRLILRTRGRVPLVVSKLETMLAPARASAASLPELAQAAECMGAAMSDEAPATVHSAAPAPVEPPFEINIGRLEIHAPSSPLQLLASARARAGSTLSQYLDRRRR